MSPIGHRGAYNYNEDALPQTRTPVSYGRPPLTSQDKLAPRRETTEPSYTATSQVRRETYSRPAQKLDDSGKFELNRNLQNSAVREDKY